MNKEEINKTIAEYMGYETKKERGFLFRVENLADGKYALYRDIIYTDSLDVTISVVQKLKAYISLDGPYDDGTFKAIVRVDGGECSECGHTKANIHYTLDGDRSPSMALATALAKVIKDMK